MLDGAKLDQLTARFNWLQNQMAANPDPETYVALASEYSGLEDVVAKIAELREAEKALKGLDELLADKTTDREMRDIGRDGISGDRRAD